MAITFNNINTTTWCRFIAVAILLFSANSSFTSVINWESVKGWETYFIAQAIAEGEGYSFPPTHRWLFDISNDNRYHLTAWVDPFYTYCIAGFIYLFGDYHKLAVAIFNLLLYVVIFSLTYHLAERLISSIGGVLAVLLLSMTAFPTMGTQMINTFLAATFILLSASVLVSYYEKPDFRNAAILGLVLGLTVLASPGAQFFILVTVISIVFWGRKNIKSALLYSIIVCVISIAVVAPWTIRNYLVFDEFVPVRNGAGQIVFIGVIAAAATVIPEKIISKTKPAWQEETARTAVFNIRSNYDKRRSLEKFQMEYAKEVGPAQWGVMNEAQRDKWFFKEAKRFALANPIISIQLAIAKIELFARTMGRIGMLIMLLAIIGALITLKNPAVSTISLWLCFYIGPFILVIPYFTRYRATIEPLLILLAVFAINSIYHRAKYWFFKSRKMVEDSNTSA